MVQLKMRSNKKKIRENGICFLFFELLGVKWEILVLKPTVREISVVKWRSLKQEAYKFSFTGNIPGAGLNQLKEKWC